MPKFVSPSPFRCVPHDPLSVSSALSGCNSSTTSVLGEDLVTLHRKNLSCSGHAWVRLSDPAGLARFPSCDFSAPASQTLHHRYIGAAKYVLKRTSTQRVAFPYIITSPTHLPTQKPHLQAENEAGATFLSSLWSNRKAQGETSLESALRDFVLPQKAEFILPKWRLDGDPEALDLWQKRIYGDLFARWQQSVEPSGAGICKYFDKGLAAALEHFREAKRIDPRNPIVLYNLAVTLLLSKQDKEAATALNRSVQIFMASSNSQRDALAHAIHLRAVVNFHLHDLPAVIQDFSFHAVLVRAVPKLDPSVVSCDCPFEPQSLPPQHDEDRGRPTAIAKLLALRKGEIPPVRSLFQRKFSHEAFVRAVPKSETHAKPEAAASPSPGIKVSKITASPEIRQSPIAQKKSSGPAPPQPAKEKPEWRRSKLRFLNPRAYEAKKLEKLQRRIARLRDKLDHRYLRFDPQSLPGRGSDKLDEKTRALRDLAESQLKTLRLPQVVPLEKEFSRPSETRDYAFVDRVLGRLALFSRMLRKDRMLLYQSGRIVEVLAEKPLYTQDSEGTETGLRGE